MLRRDLPRPAPVHIHHVDVVGVVGVVGLVVAQVGHQPSVGRRHRRVIRPRARRQLPNRPRRHRHGIDLRLAETVVRVILAQRREEDLRAVDRPHRRPVVPVAVGQLTRRAARGGQHEDVPVSLVGIAHVIAPVVGPRHDLRLDCPLRALGTPGYRHRPLRLRRHHHRKRQRLPVGRPGQTARPVSKVAHLGLGPLRVHPAHEDLRGAVAVRAHERDPPAVRSPHRSAAVGQPPGPLAVRTDDVQLRHPAVLHLVDVPPLVKHLAAVWRNLRPHPAREQERTHFLPLEIQLRGQAAGLLLSGGGLGG